VSKCLNFFPQKCINWHYIVFFVEICLSPLIWLHFSITILVFLCQTTCIILIKYLKSNDLIFLKCLYFSVKIPAVWHENAYILDYIIIPEFLQQILAWYIKMAAVWHRNTFILASKFLWLHLGVKTPAFSFWQIMTHLAFWRCSTPLHAGVFIAHLEKTLLVEFKIFAVSKWKMYES
jgi:hypothetical protein